MKRLFRRSDHLWPDTPIPGQGHALAGYCVGAFDGLPAAVPAFNQSVPAGKKTLLDAGRRRFGDPRLFDVASGRPRRRPLRICRQRSDQLAVDVPEKKRRSPQPRMKSIN